MLSVIYTVGLLCLVAAVPPQRPPNPPNLLSDVTSCVTQWMIQTPQQVRDIFAKHINKLSDNPHYGLRYLFLLEPYLSYLLAVKETPVHSHKYLPIFTSYCHKGTGVRVFITCMKNSDSFKSRPSSRKRNTVDSVKILDNLYHRYCDKSGNVKKHVKMVLRKGTTSADIRRLSDRATPNESNSTMLCSDVIETSMQTAAQMLGEGQLRIEAFFDVIKSGIKTFTRCLMVTVAPNQKGLILKEHLELVLLRVIESNIADVTRVEMSVARQTMLLTGYTNILIQDREPKVCSFTGDQNLLSNSHMKVTGTMLHTRIDGSNMLSYLASVYIKFPVYDGVTQKEIGTIEYSSLLSVDLPAQLVAIWKSASGQREGHVSSFDHGVSLESVKLNTVEIVDLRTGTYISLRKSGYIITMIIRMYTTYIYQSSGVLLGQCYNNGQTPVYAGVLQTSSECRAICHRTDSTSINSMCQRDCLMSGNVKLLNEVYGQLQEMYNAAELKDDFIEKMSAVENKPATESLMAPGDRPANPVPLALAPTRRPADITYDHPKSVTSAATKATGTVSKAPVTMQRLLANRKLTPVPPPSKVSRRRPPPKELIDPPRSGNSDILLSFHVVTLYAAFLVIFM